MPITEGFPGIVVCSLEWMESRRHPTVKVCKASGERGKDHCDRAVPSRTGGRQELLAAMPPPVPGVTGGFSGPQRREDR